MANTSATWQKAAHTPFHLLAAQQEPYKNASYQKNACFLEREREREREEEESQENGPLAEKWQDRKSKRTRQKSKRGDRKGESNDSPESPDRGTALASCWGPCGKFATPHLGKAQQPQARAAFSCFQRNIPFESENFSTVWK